MPRGCPVYPLEDALLEAHVLRDSLYDKVGVGHSPLKIDPSRDPLQGVLGVLLWDPPLLYELPEAPLDVLNGLPEDLLVHVHQGDLETS